MRKHFLFLLAVGIIITSCKSSGTTTTAPKTTEGGAKKVAVIAMDNGLTKAEKEAGWMLLFNGHDVGKWRGYNKSTCPKGWDVVEGTLHCNGSGRGEAGAADGGDIIYPEEFQNFELTLEWKISDGGNSGILYLATELPSKTIWQTAPEMQVLDNTKHPDGRDGLHSAGALYDMIGVPADKVKPVGQWNQVKILVYKGLVEHWLNGEKVVEYHLWTPEWEAMVAKSKFPQYNPDWAKIPQKGLIGLQDHGDDVWYKNIKIRKL